MRVVADNSEQEIAKRWAARSIRWPLRELAANLLRIVRGAGRPAEVGAQATAVIVAFEEYRAAFGHYPISEEISEALIMRDDERKEHWTDWEYGVETMVRGALQMAASELVHQGTQRAAGKSELFSGLERIERIREENRLGLRKPKPFTER